MRSVKMSLVSRMMIGTLVLLSGASSAASAQRLRFEYSGLLQSIGLFNGSNDVFGMSIGDRVFASFEVDLSGADVDPDPRVFRLDGDPIASMQFQNFSADRSSINYSQLFVSTRPPLGQLSAYANVISGNVSDVYQFSSSLRDNFFAGGPVRLATVDLADLSDSKFSFQRAVDFNNIGPVSQFNGVVDRLIVTVVPEPPSFALLAIGIVVMASSKSALRRFRKRAVTSL